MLFEDVDYPLYDEDLSEIALCAIKFPKSMKLLLDPNVWIADTGATVHTTPNSSSMIKKSVKLLQLPQPPLRARTDARTNPSAQRATQLRSVLAHVYAVARQNQITTTVP
jgi:hypothetical protein